MWLGLEMQAHVRRSLARRNSYYLAVYVRDYIWAIVNAWRVCVCVCTGPVSHESGDVAFGATNAVSRVVSS